MGVEKILVEGKNYAGVELKKGQKLSSDYLISSAHPQATLSLVEGALSEKYRGRMMELENTLPSFSLYLGVNDKIQPLDHVVYQYTHNNTSEHLNPNAIKGENSAKQIFYTLTPSNLDGLNTLLAVSPVHYKIVRQWESTLTRRRPEDYRRLKEQYSEQLIDIISQHLPGLKQSIEIKESASPLTFRDYTSTWQGSTYGIKKSMEQQGPRGVYHRTRVKNLFFTGQSALLPGMLGTIISSVIACSEIIGLEPLIDKINQKLET